MVENVTLARALAREVQVGQPIKAKWFKPVAEILGRRMDMPGADHVW
jgi:type III secretory pathway component EscU